MWSVGYHGDNGCIYEEDSKWLYDTGCKFGISSTVGCGIDYASEEYFFTRDEKIVGMSLLKRFVPLYEKDLLSGKHVQPDIHQERSYTGSCTLLSVTTQGHAQSR